MMCCHRCEDKFFAHTLYIIGGRNVMMKWTGKMLVILYWEESFAYGKKFCSHCYLTEQRYCKLFTVSFNVSIEVIHYSLKTLQTIECVLLILL